MSELEYHDHTHALTALKQKCSRDLTARLAKETECAVGVPRSAACFINEDGDLQTIPYQNYECSLSVRYNLTLDRIAWTANKLSDTMFNIIQDSNPNITLGEAHTLVWRRFPELSLRDSGFITCVLSARLVFIPTPDYARYQASIYNAPYEGLIN